MKYVLLLMLIPLLLFFYYANGKRIFTASVISIGVFLASNLFIVFNPDIFYSDIDFHTVVYILSSLLMLGLGETLVLTYGRQNRIRETEINPGIEENEPIQTSNYLMLLIGLTQLAIGLYNYYILYRASLAYGNPGSLFGAIAYTRSAMTHGLLHIGNSYITLLYNTLLALATYYYIAFFYNYFFCKRANKLMLLPYICSIVNCFSSTGRTVFMKYICVALIIYVIIYQSYKGSSYRVNKKIIKIVIASFVAVIILFTLVGRMRTRVGSVYSASTNVASYFGLGIYGLDSTIKDGLGFSSKLFGQESLKWLYEILQNEFNVNLDISHFNLWYDNNGISSNVYTALCSFYKDFGFLFGILSQFLVGAIYGIVYKKINKISNWKMNAWKLVIYSYFMYPIIMYSTENLFSSVFYPYGFFIYSIVYIKCRHYAKIRI